MRVSVFGLGYVGSVTAACLAELGHQVVGVDRDGHKVTSILAGHAPFFEPGLEEMIAANVSKGTLTATASVAEAYQASDIFLICVGTPSERNGNLGLDQMRRVVGEIVEAARAAIPKRAILVLRSTVFPGTCEEVIQPLTAGIAGMVVVSNPEFLREGTAMKDFLEPPLIVVGGADPEAVAHVARLYEPLNVPPCLVSLRTAEMIKYACNAFHAVKISFANEIGALSERLAIDSKEVMETLCRDHVLNVSAAYLKPGFAFGGSCLPKDLRALTYRASRLDIKLPFLESVMPANQAHLARAVEKVLDRNAQRIGVLGLAFKENTDDLRESPVVSLLEHLIGKGRNVRVYDPHIQLEALYGSNREFIFNAIPHIGRLIQNAPDQIFEWADLIVVAQKPNPDLAARLRTSQAAVINLVDPPAPA